MNSLWVSEYGSIFCGDHNCLLDNGNLQLKKFDFESLIALTEPVNDENSFDQILSLHRRHGQDYLKVHNYVGVIRTPLGIQIEVLPKISKAVSSPNLSRQLLVKMLISLQSSPFKQARIASLDAHKMPLFEVFLRYFLDEVVHIVKRGIARNYMPQQDNLRFIRGKLLMKEDIKHNVANRASFFCEYDEYNEDRPVNRVIRGALDVVLKCSSNPENIRLCHELKYIFDNVTPTHDPILDFSRIKRDRSIQHYDSALTNCELILKGMNPLTQQGSKEVFSLLFPMERVFEDYVSFKLSDQFPDLKIKTQVSSKYLVQSHDHTDRRMFRLKPDLELMNSYIHIIADTKWKLLNKNDLSSKYQIKESDMYQLFAYGEKYLKTYEKFNALILIYPRTDQFDQPLPTFWFDKEKAKGLYVLPYDLERDRLVLNRELSFALKKRT